MRTFKQFLNEQKTKGVVAVKKDSKKYPPFVIWGMKEAIDIKRPNVNATPKIKKPNSKLIKPIQTVKPLQSNIKNQIDALAGQPTGHKSSISTGDSV